MESLRNIELYNIFGLVAYIKRLVLVDPQTKLQQDGKNKKKWGTHVELTSFVWPCVINAGELWNKNDHQDQTWSILL